MPLPVGHSLSSNHRECSGSSLWATTPCPELLWQGVLRLLWLLWRSSEGGLGNQDFHHLSGTKNLTNTYARRYFVHMQASQAEKLRIAYTFLIGVRLSVYFGSHLPFLSEGREAAREV